MDFMAENQIYAFGGSLIEKELCIRCFLIDFLEAKSQGEAEVLALKNIVQSVLLEYNIPGFEMQIISSSKVLDSLINYPELLNWETRFKRNLFLSFKKWLQNICFLYIPRLLNKFQQKWSQIKRDNSQRLLVKWIS